MKKKTRDILKNILTDFLVYIFVIGLFIFAIGLGYRSQFIMPKQPNFIVTIIGLVIIFPFIIWFILLNNRYKKKHNNIVNKSNNLKRDIIELKNVKIIKYNNKNTNYYSTEIGKTELQKNNMCKNVVIEFYYNKQKKTYSFKTTKDLNTLKIHLNLKKETTIFLDKKNTVVDLDLSFLK